MFLLYNNDLYQFCRSSTVHIYAHDSAFLCAVVKVELQIGFDAAAKWFKDNRSTLARSSRPISNIYGTIIMQIFSGKYLDLQIDRESCSKVPN